MPSDAEEFPPRGEILDDDDADLLRDINPQDLHRPAASTPRRRVMAQASNSPFLDSSGWTFDTLNTYITGWVSSELSRHETMFTERDKAISAALVSQEKAIRAALESAEKAVNKAEGASEKRFEAVNEFRAQLSDQAATFMPRNESTIRWDTTNDRIDALTARIEAINSRLNINDGKTEGLDKGWGYLAGAIGIAGTVVALVIGTR